MQEIPIEQDVTPTSGCSVVQLYNRPNLTDFVITVYPTVVIQSERHLNDRFTR